VAIEPEAVIGDPGQDRSGRPVLAPSGVNPAGVNPASLSPVGFNPAGFSPVGFGPGGAGTPGAGHRRAARARGGRRGTAAALTAVVIGVAGMLLTGSLVYSGMMPRTFTPAEQQQIMAWEVAARWRELPAGVIFPATATYPPPSALQDGGALTLEAKRLGIARGVPCGQAADAVAARILDASGCQGLLRSTYVDQTGTYLVTVGVAAFPGPAQADRASQGLTDPRLAHAGHSDVLAPGVRAATFAATPAGAFTDSKRQVAGSVRAGPYILLYAIGYADGRPKVPVDVDGYTYAEMTSMGQGLAHAIARTLTVPPLAPRCPGAPGC
jgi:hypothetical protein